MAPDHQLGFQRLTLECRCSSLFVAFGITTCLLFFVVSRSNYLPFTYLGSDTLSFSGIVSVNEGVCNQPPDADDELSISGLLSIRLHALYGFDRRVKYFLAISLAALIVASLGLAIYQQLKIARKKTQQNTMFLTIFSHLILA